MGNHRDGEDAMASNLWDSLDVHLLRVLHALLTENSVSRAARRLNQSQPAVSVALRRLRDLTGDQLLVRSRNGMTPTERGASLLEPVRIALEQIETIALRQVSFDPAQSRRMLNIAMPDYLNGVQIGEMVRRLHAAAPAAQVIFHSLGAEGDYASALEAGRLDLVIGNWPSPPEYLRITPLFEDEMVVLMRNDHALAQGTMSVEQFLGAEHVAPTPYSVGQRGVVDTFLARERLKRNIVTWVPYFHLAPCMLLHTDLIFTAPRKFAEHHTRTLPLVVRRPPLDFPAVPYYLLWHDRTHYSDECRWFREAIVSSMQESRALRLQQLAA